MTVSIAKICFCSMAEAEPQAVRESSAATQRISAMPRVKRLYQVLVGFIEFIIVL